MCKIFFLLLFQLSILFVAAPVFSGNKQLIMIIDTSGSMSSNDPAAYSIQTAKIMNDLLQVGDHFSAIRFPASGSCSNYANSSLATSNRVKSTLDSYVNRSDDTDFTAPVMTTMNLMKSKPAEKMLIIISDVGGSDLLSCAKDQKNLEQLKKSGVTLAAINIGAGDLTNNNSLFAYSKFVNNSPDLIEAVANIYQRFIGGKKTQTGRVSSKKITVTMDANVKEAYLVVAAEGDVGDAHIVKPHPRLKSAFINHKGGGTTTGHDGWQRSYRIIRLENPGAGEWTFSFPKMSSTAGWMLIQDYSVSLRLVTEDIVTNGVTTTIEVELFDELTGKAIIAEPGTTITIDIDGIPTELIATNDGTFKLEITPSKIGEQVHIIRVNTGNIDKKIPIKLKVIEGAWIMDVQMPEKAEIETSVKLSVKFIAQGRPEALPTSIQLIVHLSTGEKLNLQKKVKPTEFFISWKAKKTGKIDFVFKTSNQLKISPVKKRLTVVGSLKFGDSIPISFGRLVSESSTERQLDFSTTEVKGSVDIKLSSSFNNSHTQLEIKNKGQWQTLDGSIITLEEGKNNQWQVRVNTEKCPEASQPSEIFIIKATYTKLDGALAETDFIFNIEIIDDPWYACWWPLMLTIFLLLITWRMIHCILTPARFPPEFGLLLSSEPELNEEGIFHRIRNYKGANHCFCHDAQIYLHEDFRFTSSDKGAFVKLRAGRNGVHLLVTGNGILLQKRLGDDWEEVPAHEEMLLRTGIVYRNGLGTLFFEAR